MKLCLLCNFQFEDEQELCPKDFSKLVPLGKDQLIGKLVQDRYRVESIIARGSMGTIYKAIQELIGREVAIKVLHGYLVSDDESIKRFHKEAKAASRLNHPSITTVYDYGVLSSGQPYIVMDLLRGTSLGEVLHQRGCLPFEEALPILDSVCQAIEEAHARGVIHRDIKPENIVLEYSDAGVTVKMVDFGIAKFIQEQDDTIGKITKTGTVCGSPTYMSPEQCDDNQVDQRSDIYSLGVVVYEMLCGKVPFSSDDIYTVMTMHVRDKVPPLREMRPDILIPAHAEAAINKALAKNPDERFQSAAEFFDSLKGKKQNVPVGAPALTAEADAQTPASAALSALEMRLNSAAHYEPAEHGSRSLLQEGLAEIQARRKEQSAHARIRPVKVSLGMRLFGLAQLMLPALLTMALFGTLWWVIKNEARLDKVIGNIPGQGANKSADADDLIAAGKFDQARTLLEKRLKAGKLSAADRETLDSIYLRLAKKEAKAKHYKQAVHLLEQMKGEDREEEQVRLLLKKYKKAAGIK